MSVVVLGCQYASITGSNVGSIPRLYCLKLPLAKRGFGLDSETACGPAVGVM
jgi:hypothetical protein